MKNNDEFKEIMKETIIKQRKKRNKKHHKKRI